MSRPIYFTFPVPILRGAFTDLDKVCNNAIHYVMYQRYAQCEDKEETLESLGISAKSFEKSVRQGERLAEQHQGEPLVSIKGDLVFTMRNEPQSDFQIAVFLAFCGLRSILGDKD